MKKMEKGKIYKYFMWASLFAVSMGYFEAAVVVYLREILCVDGALFPLNIEFGTFGLVEIGREFFSLVMLVSVSAILSRNRTTGVAWFCFLFGIWDLFYYLFLKVLIDWPASIMTWDILFLIPVPWVSPVLAPVIASLTLISLSVITVSIYETGREFKYPGRLLLSELAASLVMIVSFCWQWRAMLAGGIPADFPWIIFGVSELLIILFFSIAAAKTVVITCNHE